ncbi:MAG: beta-ketoacyl synthase, partial [Bacteroidaceae bacterium]|nr:beta-ketoacyl synthase [Bacteroidaceae bacterium]
MISVLSTNITSPLGFTTEQNYQAVLTGTSALKRYEGMWGLPEPFAASLFSEEQKAALVLDGFTRFESLAIRSVREALSHIQLDVASS